MSRNENNYIKVNRNGLVLALAAIGLVIATAAAAAYFTQEHIDTAQVTARVQETPKPMPRRVVAHSVPQQQVAQAQPQPVRRCNDSNIVGTVLGGVGGGVVGNQVGGGTGKTVATIAGTLGGAYLGNQYIPTNGVTCR